MAFFSTYYNFKSNSFWLTSDINYHTFTCILYIHIHIYVCMLYIYIWYIYLRIFLGHLCLHVVYEKWDTVLIRGNMVCKKHFSCKKNQDIKKMKHKEAVAHKMLFKIDVLKNFGNLTGKHLFWDLFFWHSCNFMKKTLHCRCSIVKIEKFLRTTFFTKQLRWLLLNISFYLWNNVLNIKELWNLNQLAMIC